MSRQKILIVEDEIVIRTSLKKFLEKQSYIIEEAASNPSEKEIGIKIATPLAGPKPGRAPKTVPRKQPIKANVIF